MNELQELLNSKIKDEISQLHVAIPAKIKKYDHKTMYAEVILLIKKEMEGEKVEIPPIVKVPVSHTKFGDIVVRPGYKSGDIVQVLFNERALDKLLITGKPENPEYNRLHSLDDAVIISGLKIEQDDDYPDEEADSLYISNLKENNKIIMKSDGEIKIINEGVEDGTPIPEKYAEIVVDKEMNIEANRVDPDKEIDVSIRLEKEGNIVIEDKKKGTRIKLDCEGEGDLIFKLANLLLLGSDEADEGVPLGDSLKDWLDNHTHPGDSGGTTGKPTSSSPSPSEKVMIE